MITYLIFFFVFFFLFSQSKTAIPVRKIGGNDGLTKDTERAFLVPTHVTGLTMAGAPFAALAFINFTDFASDSMLNVECLRRALMKCKERLQNPLLNPAAPHPNHRRWPNKLYLQADNCSKDCKNIQMIGYCALLVHQGIFNEVQMSFMLKGHTHDRVDQLFSRIAVALRNLSGVNTLPKLMKSIKDSFKNMEVEYVDSVANTKVISLNVEYS